MYAIIVILLFIILSFQIWKMKSDSKERRQLYKELADDFTLLAMRLDGQFITLADNLNTLNDFLIVRVPYKKKKTKGKTGKHSGEYNSEATLVGLKIGSVKTDKGEKYENADNTGHANLEDEKHGKTPKKPEQSGIFPGTSGPIE